MGLVKENFQAEQNGAIKNNLNGSREINENISFHMRWSTFLWQAD